MVIAQRTAPTESGLDDAAIDAFKQSVSGDLLLPGDPGYDDARAIWNAGVDNYPAFIARVANAADVAAAVTFARTHDLLLSVRGGGHNAAGFAVADGGLMIDLSRMKRVVVDPEARIALAEAGARLGDLDAATQKFGLAVPAGTVSDTGIAGLTLGGGTGWLMRKHGLTIDNLLAVEIVTADGQLRVASAVENPDLFWGVRGGGGNFGVVVSFAYRLHPFGPLVLAGLVVYPIAQARAALQHSRDVMATAPDELTVFNILMTAPPAPPFPPDLHGKPVLAVGLAYAGPIADGEAVVAPLRRFGAPALDLVGPIPFTAWQRIADASVPYGLHHYNKAHNLTGLEDDAIDTVLAYFAETSGPLAQVHIGAITGAVARVPADATAYAHRDAAYVFWLMNMWGPGEDAERHVAWTRSFWQAMRPFSTGGAYVNAIANEGEAGVRAAYAPATYERLVALKTKYDPANLFRLNHNIRPRVPRG